MAITAVLTASYSDANNMQPRTPDALWGGGVSTPLDDDVLVWWYFRQGPTAGISAVGGMTVVYASVETYKGYGMAWKRWGDVVTSDNHGWSGGATNTENVQLVHVIRGLNPTTPFGTASVAYFYNTTIAHGTVTVPTNGGLMWVQHVPLIQRDPAITAFSPASYAVDYQDTIANIGVFADSAVASGATGTVTVSPAGTGGGGGDAFASMVPMQLATVITDARLARESTEILVEPDPDARLGRESTEVLLLPDSPNARLARYSIEVLQFIDPLPRQANAYYYENVGIDAISTKEGSAYYYENVAVEAENLFYTRFMGRT